MVLGHRRNQSEECNLYVKFTVFSFRRFVLRLQESDGIGDIGGISLKNVICM